MKLQKAISKNKKQIAEINELLNINDRDAKDETIVNGQLNAKIGEVNFNYEIAVSHGYKSKKSYLKRFVN